MTFTALCNSPRSGGRFAPGGGRKSEDYAVSPCRGVDIINTRGRKQHLNLLDTSCYGAFQNFNRIQLIGRWPVEFALRVIGLGGPVPARSERLSRPLILPHEGRQRHRSGSRPRLPFLRLEAPVLAKGVGQPSPARRARLRGHAEQVGHAGTGGVVALLEVRPKGEQAIPEAELVGGHVQIVSGRRPGRNR